MLPLVAAVASENTQRHCWRPRGVCGPNISTSYRLTSDAGILLLAAVEQRLKIAERLAACLEDRRDPERVPHGLAEM